MLKPFKNISLVIIILLLVFQGCTNRESESRLTSQVNVFIGTGGHGHTYPGATVPFGGVQLSPDTRLTGWDGCSGYHYSDNIIYGFSHTHLSGTGVPDLCDILFMPFTGKPHLKSGYPASPDSGYGSRFSHKKEKAGPGFYSVFLDDYKIKVDLTATKRAGMHRYEFKSNKKRGIIIDLKHRDRVIDSGIKIISSREIEGYRISSSWAEKQYVYFVAEFSQPFKSAEIALNNAVLKNAVKANGSNVKTILHFDEKSDKTVIVKVGISAVDIRGARENLKTEIPGWDFDKVRADADSAWQKALGVFNICGGSKNEREIFYTALYHTLIVPNIFMDVDKRYRGTDLKIHKAKNFTNYTVFSLWDTFRALHPLFTIIQQKRTSDFIKTFINQYKNGGYLPMWELDGNYTHCMIGYHAVPVIADAFVKGITDFDLKTAFKAMKSISIQNRFGTDAYIKHGYIPLDADRESVSKTLEYAYDDWCIAEMAAALGNKNDYKKYIQRAQYYKNIFDPQTGFARARINGKWYTPFDPAEVNFNFTEANSWQYSFFVPQDVQGLIKLAGGDSAFIGKLDKLFTTSSELKGRKQPDITGLIGQYAHGNEPSHHIAYLYNYAGAPWKTQEIIYKILKEMYKNNPDGLSGNEDCGQMSAWYVLSALGFYQVCPGSPIYTFGTPVFDRVDINLENGKKFTIKRNSGSGFYIKSVKLNGKKSDRTYIYHNEIINGGTLEFEMSSAPCFDFGKEPENRPFSSIKRHLITRVPYVRKGERTFKNSTVVELAAPDKNAVIYYTLNGKEPDAGSKIYSKPLTINKTTCLKMAAYIPERGFSFTVVSNFLKVNHNWQITLNTDFDNQYTAGGKNGLIDMLRGGSDFMTGLWQGYSGTDLDAVVDLGRVQTIREAGAGFLQKQRSWIFMPKRVEIFISKNGKEFIKAGEIKNRVPENKEGTIIKDFVLKLKNVKARYVKIKAENIGTIPSWHPGAGNKGWLFVDEIIIK